MPFEGEKFEEAPTPEKEKEEEEEKEEKPIGEIIRKEGFEPKLEYQDITEVLLEEVKEDDPDFEKARIVSEKPELKAEELLRQELMRENWWFQSVWTEKGAPKEQVEVKFGDKKLDVYNFSEPLTEKHLVELDRIVKEFSQIFDSQVFEKVQYILIDNNRKINIRTGEEHYGYGQTGDRAIKLYPRAIESPPYRIEGVSSFEGSVIHEFTHSLINSELKNKWQKKFGWEVEEIRTPEEMLELKKKGEEWKGWHKWKNKYPERLVNDYAKVTLDEDIYESTVAALRNPKVLDSERLQFLKENLKLDEIKLDKAPEINIQRRNGEDIKLPKLESPVKYRVKF